MGYLHCVRYCRLCGDRKGVPESERHVPSLMLRSSTSIVGLVILLDLDGNSQGSACAVSKWSPYEIYFFAILADELLAFGLVLNKCVDISASAYLRMTFRNDTVSRLILDSMLYFLMYVKFLNFSRYIFLQHL